MQRVTHQVEEVSWWRDVVSQTADRGRVSTKIILLPLAEEADKVVSIKLAMEHLREEIEV